MLSVSLSLCWIGLSVRLCWRVLMWAFCKAVLAGAGRSNGFTEAVLAGSHVGFL